MLPPDVERAAHRYLRIADRLLPSRIVGFYIVGSVALGAYRPGRSDIDFVAVLDEPLDDRGIRRLRALQVASGGATGALGLTRGQPLTGTMNGSFVTGTELRKPVSDIVPVASHTGHELHVGTAFDVNPVVWKVFAERGIAVRGPEPAELDLQPQPELLRQWNLDNLDSYWRGLGERLQSRPATRLMRLRPRWWTAWGVLGPPRLHCTIGTGAVIGKEEAGEYAREIFGAEWRPLIDEALAYWRGQPPVPGFDDLDVRMRQVGRFIDDVVKSAHDIP